MIHLKSVLVTNLKARRKFLGLTQEKLAEIINTAPTYIAMIEAERRTPSFQMIERLAKALKIDPPELFYLSNYPAETSTQIHEILMCQFDKFLRSVSKEMMEKEENKLY